MVTGLDGRSGALFFLEPADPGGVSALSLYMPKELDSKPGDVCSERRKASG
jgi:hypothetical protein